MSTSHSSKIKATAENKESLVVDETQRKENARSLAEAWGLVEGEEDDLSDTKSEASENGQVPTSRNHAGAHSLERRLDKERKRVKNMEKSQELQEWRSDEEEEAGVIKSKSKARTGRSQAQADFPVHPLAAEAEGRLKSDLKPIESDSASSSKKKKNIKTKKQQ